MKFGINTFLFTSPFTDVCVRLFVKSPALELLLDTFHMNIKEKDVATAIRRPGRHPVHFHACASNRGTPGNDHVECGR